MMRGGGGENGMMWGGGGQRGLGVVAVGLRDVSGSSWNGVGLGRILATDIQLFRGMSGVAAEIGDLWSGATQTNLN